MSDKKLREVRLPFPGMYQGILESGLSNELDEVAEEHGLDSGESTFCGLCDYQPMRLSIAKQWTTELVLLLNGLTGVPVSFEMKELVTPRYFNYATDEIYVDVPLDQLLALHRWLTTGHPGALEAKAKDMFSDRPGFFSAYDPDITTWKELQDWDHNQWYCLLCAIVEQEEDYELDLYYGIEFSEAVSEGIDWKKLEETK